MSKERDNQSPKLWIKKFSEAFEELVVDIKSRTSSIAPSLESSSGSDSGRSSPVSTEKALDMLEKEPEPSGISKKHFIKAVFSASQSLRDDYLSSLLRLGDSDEKNIIRDKGSFEEKISSANKRKFLKLSLLIEEDVISGVQLFTEANTEQIKQLILSHTQLKTLESQNVKGESHSYESESHQGQIERFERTLGIGSSDSQKLQLKLAADIGFNADDYLKLQKFKSNIYNQAEESYISHDIGHISDKIPIGESIRSFIHTIYNPEINSEVIDAIVNKKDHLLDDLLTFPEHVGISYQRIAATYDNLEAFKFFQDRSRPELKILGQDIIPELPLEIIKHCITHDDQSIREGSIEQLMKDGHRQKFNDSQKKYLVSLVKEVITENKDSYNFFMNEMNKYSGSCLFNVLYQEERMIVAKKAVLDESLKISDLDKAEKQEPPSIKSNCKPSKLI